MLSFKKYKKKIDKNTILELDFSINEGEILAIISNRVDEIKILKESFREKTKFKGSISFNDILVSKQKMLFYNDYGFYNHLSLEKNLIRLAKIFKIKVSKEEADNMSKSINLDLNKKYSSLEENEKIKFHTLFSIIIKQKILIIDNTQEFLSKEDKEDIRNFILNKSNKSIVIIFDTMLNRFNNIADNVLVLSDGLKSYFGSLDDLLIIKQLAAISISHKEDLNTILRDYRYTLYNDGEIVVREDVLEAVVYELLKNGIEVYQIRNLGEKIKLYEGEGEI